MDLIFKTTSYLDDKSINKITTEEYCNLDLKEIIWNIDMIIFDRFTSHDIHLSNDCKRSYRINNTVMTIKQLKDFIKIEEAKFDFLKKVNSDVINSNQQTFDFDNNNDNCTTLEYDIPNEWLCHYKGDCQDNSYKIIININF